MTNPASVACCCVLQRLGSSLGSTSEQVRRPRWCVSSGRFWEWLPGTKDRLWDRYGGSFPVSMLLVGPDLSGLPALVRFPISDRGWCRVLQAYPLGAAGRPCLTHGCSRRYLRLLPLWGHHYAEGGGGWHGRIGQSLGGPPPGWTASGWTLHAVAQQNKSELYLKSTGNHLEIYRKSTRDRQKIYQKST